MADNDDTRARTDPRATLLLTRPRAASERFAADVAQRGLPLDTVIAPLMDIVAADPMPVLPTGAGVIFTSANAVMFAGPGAGRRAWCVGARTTDAARQAGFDATMAGASAEGLVADLLDLRPVVPLVHLHGRHQRGDVARRLGDAGLTVTSHMLYDQVAVPPDPSFTDALVHRPLLIPLFSPRSAELFAAAAGPVWQSGRGVTLLALSAAVAAAVPSQWRQNTDVAARPDGPAMLDAIARRIFP